ncbi:prolyl oligopeptidase family serine peptidase [Congregibacter sp.]|uniref:prolyl oligopeptidase family serine peptidase n=1 Tax=Congregibacter sp. TaxID=2744308 RepID=UPI003F6C0422
MRSHTFGRFTTAILALLSTALSASFTATLASAQNPQSPEFFSALDIFELEWALNPQISPDGQLVVYRRMGFDIMQDKRRGDLWLADVKKKTQRKLSSFEGNESSAVWSPDGARIAYVRSAGEGEGSEIYLHWLAEGQSARVTRLPETPKDLQWSPDGKQLAFVMDVKTDAPKIATRPEKPEGANWSKPPRLTDRMYHERDGSGYLEAAFSHVFVVPADGGTARQISSGNFHHHQPSWTADGSGLIVSGNRAEDWEYDYRNSELYRIALADGETTVITTTDGPDRHPELSPNGKHLAWLGYADKKEAFQVTRLRIADPDGSNVRELLGELDRSVKAIVWSADSSGLYFQYDDKGRTKVAFVSLKDKLKTLADNLGGTSIGRPYAGGSFSVSNSGVVAYTHTRPEYPAEIAIYQRSKVSLITQLNEDLLGQRSLGETREIWWKSSYDQRDIQGWMVLPPDFDPAQKYPLLVENHGGPILNYGERFSPEMQLFAAAGYVVFYPNARGSTSYGEEFANLLYHNYPGQDYDDTMSGVDAMIDQGFIDPEQLYVTGGSAGGIMTAWMIGKSDRFRAAAAIKPVMNWYSKTLNADNWYNYYHTRIPGTPWTNPDDYLRFSPISLVGNVNTPTLVMVGLDDLRTPPSQAKQLYHALKYRKVPTTLVELPGASHFIAKKPSQLIDKIGHILGWFERYR